MLAGVPIRAAAWPDLLAHRELASLAVEREGGDRSQTCEPCVAVRGHRKDLVALALTEFIDLTLRKARRDDMQRLSASQARFFQVLLPTRVYMLPNNCSIPVGQHQRKSG